MAQTGGDYQIIKDNKSIFDQAKLNKSAKAGARSLHTSQPNTKPSIPFMAVGRNSAAEQSYQTATLLQAARRHESKASNEYMVSILAHRDKTLKS